MTTVVQTTLHWIFACVMLSGASQTILHWVFSVQCCPTSIKTTLNRIFSGAMLSGASGTTLHKVFLCVILSHIEQNYLWQVLKTRNCLCNTDPECIDIFLLGNNLHIIALIYLGQNSTIQSPCNNDPESTNNIAKESDLQCCLNLCANITQGRHLCSVGPKLIEHFYEENNLYTVLSTILGQHCIGT